MDIETVKNANDLLDSWVRNATNAAQRETEQHKRDAEAGLVQVEVTVHEGQQADVKAYAEKLRRRAGADKPTDSTESMIRQARLVVLNDERKSFS
jgi:hypothetical protein